MTFKGYTIKDVSKMTNIPASTLRYYDKEGLLPFLQRGASGYRVFQEGDLEMLYLLQQLKATGMSIQEMKQFIDWVQEGSSTLEKRLHLFEERRAKVLQEMEKLQQTLAVLKYKCNYYKQAVELGVEPKNNKNGLPYQDRFYQQHTKE